MMVGLRRTGRAWLLLAALVLTGCNSESLRALLPQPSPSPSATVSVNDTPTLTVGTETPESVPTVGPKVLNLWVPPQFDPSTGTPAAMLLQERLQAFTHRNPDVELRVRVKAMSGPGGLLESLASAAAAAPRAVPSLVALPRADLETAALKGLVYPLDGMSSILDDLDWYPYARELGQVENSLFGLPFAGDALLMVYRPEKVGITPSDWPSVLSLGRPVIFPAADSQSQVTMALYQSAGGVVANAQRRPMLQADVLGQVLSLYSGGARQGGFPYWLAQYETDGQAWQAYREQRANFLVTWSSQYLADLPADSSAIPLPGLGEEDNAYATGWLWAVSDPDPEQRALSIRLAEYLVGSSFLSDWSAAAGMLPVRPASLAAWENQNLRALVGPIVLAAQSRPTNDLVASLGPVLQDATLQVIKNQADPVQAAEAAAERLNIQ